MTVEEILERISRHMRPSLTPHELGCWLHWLDRRGLATRTKDRRWSLTDEGHRSFGLLTARSDHL